MLPRGVVDRIQANVNKPSFWKSLSPGEIWKSKSMRIIPEEFVRSTPGAFDHRVVFSVRWGNSWQLWLERENKDLFMIEEDWDMFVDDNHLGPNDNLFFRHDDTMFLEVQIFKSNGNEIMDVPLEVEPEPEPLHPKHQDSHKETTTATASVEFSRNGRARQGCADVKNPERYLRNPANPYFVKTVTKRNDVLYVPKKVIKGYDLKFGPPNSPMSYHLPDDKKMEGLNKLYPGGGGPAPCFSGWMTLCRTYNLKTGDSVVCELERSGGLVTAVRVHFVNQELDKSMFSSGTMVEVSTVIDKSEVAWFPAMIVKEIKVDDGKKFVVKDCNKHLSFNGDEATIVDSCLVRPTPPPFPVEDYTLLDRVEAFRSSVWRQGLVRGVLADKRYMVCLGTTKEETVYKHSDLRPCKVWEDGVWLNRPKRNPIEATALNVIKTKPMRSCSGAKSMTPKRTAKHTRRSLNLEENGQILTKAETGAATGELRKKRANDVIIDNTSLTITPQVKSIETESVKPLTPSPAITVRPLKQTQADTRAKTSPKKTIEPMRNKNGLKNNSTQQKMLEEKNSEEKGRKRKREEIHNSDLKETDETCNGSIAEINDTSNNICNDDDVDDQPLSAWINLPTELSFDHSPIVVNNVAAATDVEETQGKDMLTILPFAKKSPYWKTFETQEICKTVPQSPHFSPLFEAKEDFREWRAVGMMVTFYGLLEEVKNLQLDVSTSKLSSLSCSFAELEKHGFEVATPQSWINKIMCLQNDRAKKEEERKCLEKKIEADEMERHKLEEEMVELECKILELKRQQEVAKEKKEAVDKRTIEMESCAETIEQEIEDLKVEFQTTASAPW